MPDDPIINADKIERSKKLYEEIYQTHMKYLSFWKETTLWHWEFWFSLFLIVCPWIIWWLCRKRGSEGRLLLVGFFVLLVASWLDFLGVAFGAWFYTGKAVPVMPTFFPWDSSLLPVTVMLWLQFQPHWNPFVKAVIYALIVAFIGEPLFEWLGFYTPLKWHTYYSFPVYIGIFLVSHRFSKMISFDTL